jgi:hypothetical protein
LDPLIFAEFERVTSWGFLYLDFGLVLDLPWPLPTVALSYVTLDWRTVVINMGRP